MTTKPGSSQLRQTMLDAGAVVLERDQLRLVADSISYTKVFTYLAENYSVRITRASVHERIWESHDHFRQDVLKEAIAYFPTVLPNKRIVQVFEAALKIAHTEPTVEHRIDTFVRLLFAATGEIVLQSPARRHLQSAKAISSRFNDPDAANTFPTLLSEHLDAVTDTAEVVFAGLQKQLQIEANPSLGLDAKTVGRLAETLRNAIDCGAFLNTHAGSTTAQQPVRFRGLNELNKQSWFPASIAQSFLVRHFFTPSNKTVAVEEKLEEEYANDPKTYGLPRQYLSDSDVRRSREELQKLVLAAGVELLLNTALELKPASLTYANVFKYVQETSGTVIYRASVHKRIWGAQEEYVLDVLNHSLTQTAPILSPEQTDNSTATPNLRDGTSNKRQTAQDNIRDFSQSLSSLYSESNSYRRLLLTKAALFGKQDLANLDELRSTIQRTDDEFVATCKEFTRTNLLAIGFQVRPELQISEEEALDIFGVSLHAAITGLNLDHMAGITSSFQHHKLPRADDEGQTEEWNLEGIATWVFFDQLFTEVV